MSLSFGLDQLMQKHKLNLDNFTHFTVKNPKSLFDVVHNEELLKKEQTQFLKQHLFKTEGGFPDKKVGFPGLKTFDSNLPNVLKDIHNEDTESTLSNEKIAQFVAENKDLILDHEQSEDYTKIVVQQALKNKSLKAKEKELNKRFSGRGKPVFTIRNNEIQLKFEPKTEASDNSDLNSNVNDTTVEMKHDDSYTEEEQKQAQPELYQAILSSLNEQKESTTETNVTNAQKDKMREILGDNFKELKAKPKQKVSVIVINKDGEILQKVKSLKYISHLEKDNRPILVKNNHYFGRHTLLENGNVILYLNSKAFNKLEKKGTKEQKKLLSQRKIQSTRSRVKEFANIPKMEDMNSIALS